ncbi:hypothetical protein D3C78_1730830 [compost metagenome]
MRRHSCLQHAVCELLRCSAPQFLGINADRSGKTQLRQRNRHFSWFVICIKQRSVHFAVRPLRRPYDLAFRAADLSRPGAMAMHVKHILIGQKRKRPFVIVAHFSAKH